MIRSGGRRGRQIEVDAAGRSPAFGMRVGLGVAAARYRGPRCGSRDARTCARPARTERRGRPATEAVRTCRPWRSRGRQEPVDLLVDRDDRDSLAAGALRGERAAALRVAAGDQRPPQLRVGLERRSAGSSSSPHHGHATSDVRAGALGPAGVAQVIEIARGVFGLVGADRATDPQADPERRLTPAGIAGSDAAPGGGPRTRRSAWPRAGTAGRSAGAACSASARRRRLRRSARRPRPAAAGSRA